MTNSVSICDHCNSQQEIKYKADPKDPYIRWTCEECGWDNRDLIVPEEDVLRYLRVNYEALAVYKDDGKKGSFLRSDIIHRAVLFKSMDDVEGFVMAANKERKEPSVSDIVWFFDGINGPKVYYGQDINDMEGDDCVGADCEANCFGCDDCGDLGDQGSEQTGIALD